MKIVVISNSANSLLNFRGPLLSEMLNRGHTVLACAPDFDDNIRADLSGLGVMTVDYSMSRSSVNPLRELSVILQLYAIMRRHRPDVSFGYMLKPVFYSAIAGWLAGVPKRYGLIEGLGYSFSQPAHKSWLKWFAQSAVSLLAKLSAGLVERLIFLNPDDVKEFVDKRLVSYEKTALLGGIGLDLEEWSETPIYSESISYILVARLLREKGVCDYIEAARELRLTYPGVRFTLLGGLDDNPSAVSREEVESWVQEGIVEWPGHVEVRPWLAKASVFVLPSYYREGVPRSTQEALALGRAVVTTDVPGCRETVVNGLNGFLVPPRSPAALANAMRHFIEHPADIITMGLESRKLAEQRFDVHVQNAKLLSFMNL